MEKYWLLLLGVSLLAGVTELLMPRGGERAYVKLVGALCVLCLLISPLTDMLHALRTLDTDIIAAEFATEETEDYARVFADYVTGAETQELERQLEGLLRERFEMEEDSLEVRSEWEGERLNCIWICIYPSGMTTDPEPIEDFVETTLGFSCEILYDI